MTPETRYRYETKIKALEAEIRDLRDSNYRFRTACSEIYDGLISVLESNNGISIPWILKRLKRCWRE